MHQIKINGYTIEIPSKWNELSPKQLLYIAEYIDIWQLLVNSNINLGKSKALLLFSLLDTSPRKIFFASHKLFRPFFSKKQRAICNLIDQATPEDMEQLLHLTHFIFEKNELTKNLIPFVKVGDRRYYGPSDQCDNLRFGEFVFAEEFFKAFCANGNEKYLTLMVAALYRPAKISFNPEAYDTDGDIREPFNKSNLEIREKRFEKMPGSVKKAIMIFYISFREKMVSRNPEIFPANTDEEGDSKKSKKKTASWADVLLKMARSKNMDDEVLEKKLLSTILMELKQIAQEQLKTTTPQ